MNLTKKLTFPFIILVFSILYLFSAWVADDAYITFRTIENFHNGYGLRWNIDERVQSYTHPLWMLNLLIGKYIIDDLYYLVIILGFSYTLLTLYILYQLTKHHLSLFILTNLIFFSSKAVLDFSSSGLENSLSYFLISLFFYLVIKLKEQQYFYLYLSLTLSAMFLNRMDLIITFLPLALYFFFYVPYQKNKLRTSIVMGLIGFIPVIIWSSFSIYYYGSFFANSVIAKTNLGLPSTQLQIQGLKYLYANLIYDPFTSIFIYSILIYTIFSKKIFNKLLGIGLFLYLIYLINIGADYMYGRFLTTAFVTCLFIVVINNKKILNRLFPLLIILSIFNLYQYTLKDIKKFEINSTNFTDERAFYYKTTGLLLVVKNKNLPISDHFDETLTLFNEPISKPTILYTMGFNGYIMSKTYPEKHIVDLLALTDSFSAAHPMSYGYWRIGHFYRAVNAEYLTSIEHKINAITLPEDRYVLDQVWLMSRAPLTDKKRLDAILNWHTGKTFNLAKKAFEKYPHEQIYKNSHQYGNTLWYPNQK
ncbi:hypothetical protein [Acinetobacter sp. YH16031]|uniref:hypothetical protein n=1 Tax=Acinetobacter sp. YH16031 TaxID=2601180 RepID=UPI0015D408B5|nr:hypothetical protein [Acinetobacter sp. YH16031]